MSEHPDPLDWLATEQREPGVRVELARNVAYFLTGERLATGQPPR